MVTTIQGQGTRLDLEAQSVCAEIAFSTFAESQGGTGVTFSSSRQVVEYGKDDSVILNPELMMADTPQPFAFLGHDFVAIKRDNESIDFYFLE